MTVQECRSLYSGCGDGDTRAVTTPLGTVQYDPWCPCWSMVNGQRSNVLTAGTVVPPPPAVAPTPDPCASVTCKPTACHSAGVCNQGACSVGGRVADGTQCNDANAATGNDVCTAGVCAGTVPAVVNVALTLNVDIATIPPGSPAEATFKTNFANDVASMLTGVDASQIEIIGIRTGSLTVDFRINPKAQASGPVSVDLAVVKAAFASTVTLPRCVLAAVLPMLHHAKQTPMLHQVLGCLDWCVRMCGCDAASRSVGASSTGAASVTVQVADGLTITKQSGVRVNKRLAPLLMALWVVVAGVAV
eukprot:COSAG01_NODE_656_length_14462_cov_20.440716_2_plen_304_part_00